MLVPLLGWEVARRDNAFLGLYLIALLAFVFGAGCQVDQPFLEREPPRQARRLDIPGGLNPGQRSCMVIPCSVGWDVRIAFTLD